MSDGKHTVEFTAEQMKMMQCAVVAYSEQFESGTLWVRSRCGFCGMKTSWDSIREDQPRKSKHFDHCCRDELLAQFEVD